MADKERVWGLSFDVSEKSLESLRNLETLLSSVERKSTHLAGSKKIQSPHVETDIKAEKQRVAALRDAFNAAIKSTQQRAKEEESAAKASIRAEKQRAAALRESFGAAIKATQQRARAEESASKAAIRAEKERSAAIRRAGNEAIKAAKQRANEERKVELATLKTARAAERAAKSAQRARDQFKSAFLSIGASSSSGFGAMVRNAGAAALAFMSLHRVLSKIGEAKDRYLRFDELTTATLTITHAGEQAFEFGSRGAEKYRDALRAAADDVKVTSDQMADSALFWAKAGQTNSDTIVELSKVGVQFARANRDAANNVLDQARANDILSDALQLFRKDTSTTDKARAEAVSLGDKLTAAANAGNIVVEQLFDYSKKVAGLFKTGEVADEEIMAIATSLASAGLKEESGVHVRRILTQLAQGSVQKLLKNVGIEVSDKEGNIRSFGDIFGELQNILKTQKPLERMKFLKDLFGQRAVATAAAMAGLNDQGLEGNSASIQNIIQKIKESEGLAAKNQEQYLKTSAGRVQALTSVWSNALDKVLSDSGIIQKVLTGLEDIDPREVFQWLEKEAVPALESLGNTLSNVVIPGVQMTAEALSSWMSPAMSMLSGLLGSTTSNAEGFADTMTTIVKLWVKWRIAIMAIKGLRMIDWFADFAKKAAAAAAATKAIGTTTTSSVNQAKTAVGGLAGAFTIAGGAIAAAIAAWGLYDLLVGPIIDAENRMEDFRAKYGKGLENLRPGQESYDTLGGRLRDAQRTYDEFVKQRAASARTLPGSAPQVETQRERDLLAEINRLKSIQAEQVRKESGIGKNDLGVGRYQGGKSTLYKFDRSAFYRPGQEGGQSRQDLDKLYLDLYGAVQSKDADLLSTAQEAYENALNQKLGQYQEERAALQKERDETFERFAKANGEDRDLLYKQLGSFVDRLKENSDKIGEFTSDLDNLAEAMGQSEEKQQFNQVEEAVKKERERKRGGSFHGGKTEPLNPFATPLLSGIDEKGNRIINIALQPGNAAEYYRKSPESRAALGRELTKNQNIYHINFGDNSLTVEAKSNADPQAIAKAVKDEWWKIGQRQKHDVERVLGITAPPEI